MKNDQIRTWYDQKEPKNYYGVILIVLLIGGLIHFGSSFLLGKDYYKDIFSIPKTPYTLKINDTINVLTKEALRHQINISYYVEVNPNNSDVFTELFGENQNSFILEKIKNDFDLAIKTASYDFIFTGDDVLGATHNYRNLIQDIINTEFNTLKSDSNYYAIKGVDYIITYDSHLMGYVDAQINANAQKLLAEKERDVMLKIQKAEIAKYKEIVRKADSIANKKL